MLLVLKASEKQRAKRYFEKKTWKNNARNDVLEKSLGKTTHETMFWKKALQKQRAKRCFGKKPWKNNAQNGVSFLKPCRMCAGSILLCFAPFFSCLLAFPIGKQQHQLVQAKGFHVGVINHVKAKIQQRFVVAFFALEQ